MNGLETGTEGRGGMLGGGGGFEGPEQLLKPLAANAARAQNRGSGGSQVDHGGFDSDAAVAAVQDQIDIVAQIAPDMLGGGGADAVGSVGAGGGDGAGEFLEQLQGDGMIGTTDGDGGEAGRDGGNNLLGFG